MGLRRTGRGLGKERNWQIVTPSPQILSRTGGRMGQSSRQNQNDQQNESRPPIWNAHYRNLDRIKSQIYTHTISSPVAITCQTPFYLGCQVQLMSEPNPCHCYVDWSLFRSNLGCSWLECCCFRSRFLQFLSTSWGFWLTLDSQLSGGYNVIRFLHMDDKTSPYLSSYRPADGWTAGTVKNGAA